MAYTPNTLAMRASGFIEGTFNVWEYTTTDGLNAVLATGYFSDGSSKGMLVGDVVWVVNQTAPSGNNPSTPSATLCVCSLSTVTTTGGLTQHVGSSTVIVQVPAGLYSNPRNVLDGGDATINPWQRGNSVTASSATTVTYAADRWFLSQAVTATSAYMAKFANSSTTGTLAITGFTQAFSWGRTQSSGSVSTVTVGQVLESNDSFRLQGQTVSFSFWAASNTGFTAGQASSLIGITMVQGYGSDQSATSAVAGTWTTSQNVISATQVITSTMTRYSFSGTVSNTATQVGVLLSYTPTATTATTAETVIMNGLQLEVGGTTAFEHREIEQELAYCQRYYFQINEPGLSGSILGAGMNGTNSATFVLQLPVQMRIAPTVTVTQGSFGVQVANAGYTALTTFAAGTTHTVNYISVTGQATIVSGQASFLVSSSATTGRVNVTADL